MTAYGKAKLILFDLDGTLTNPGLGITNSVMHALAKKGITVADRSELYRFIGPPLIESFEEFYGFSHADAVQALADYREYFSVKGLLENEVLPGAVKLLAALKGTGRKVVLATSKPELFARRILAHFDLLRYFDGVPYPGARELLQRLKESDMEYGFLTNNSSIPPCDYCEKLRRIGFPVEPRNVVTSGDGALVMLKAHGLMGKRLYILGTERFRGWMASEGFPHCDDVEAAQALLVAFDKEVDYAKLTAVTRLALRGVPVYATHPDVLCPPGSPDVGMFR